MINRTVPASPAIGTPLEVDPVVMQVTVACYWPFAGGVGNSFWPLRAPAPRHNGSADSYKLSGSDADHTLREFVSPSAQLDDPAAFDVHVMRAAPSGGWVDIVVTLKPGNTTLPPFAPPQQLLRPR